MTRVDAHHHVWDLGRRPQPWLGAASMASIHRTVLLDELAGPAAEAGVGRSVLVQVLPDAEETTEFLALAAGSELVAGVVGWADLTRGAAVADLLARLRAAPGGHLLAGVRHLVQGEADPRWLCRADVRAGLAAVADAGLAYDLLVLPHQLPAAIETVRALPGLTFVLDHLAKPPIAAGRSEPWAGLIATLAAEPNVHAKLSGLVTEADWARWTVADLRPYAERALEVFGPSRLMFGSDWPVCLLAADYGQVAAAAEELTSVLSAAERAEVFGGTAERVYGLPPA
ncbi:amidohydrolase family protein [Streptomyces sp. MP131-18]|uniref:amidohydrolase family protein n=1 Tax=Streptomyces sp. MP131-18 TaxID=1857892 RepID=UPI00097BACA4|nr:amidohydrolase family protein [Streptomyces sp. MP131-18]ONK15851.1 putative metal-dependent hydrolase of the TIM-barrel fold protein [Streptomyces sp. MP131-18]